MKGEGKREHLRIGALALGALAFGAGAAGADHLLGRDDVSPTAFGDGDASKATAGSRARAAAKKGKRGPAGPQGPQGPQGLQGAPGAAGSSATGAFLMTSSFALAGSTTGTLAPGTDRLVTAGATPQLQVPNVPSGGF